MAKRIDSLEPGTPILLRFNREFQGPNQQITEPAIFVQIDGVGDERKAEFISPREGDHAAYTWQAYRFQGRWCYGSSAETISLVEVGPTFETKKEAS